MIYILAAIVSMFSTSLVAQEAQQVTVPDSVEQIYPLIQNQNTLDTARDVDQWVTTPLAGDLVVTYVIADDGNSRSPVTADLLNQLSLDQKNLHKLALENMQVRAGEAVISGSEEGLFFIALDGNAENALLLDSALWDSVTAQVGPIIMSAPAPHLVLFIPQNSNEGFQVITEIRSHVLATQTPTLSAQLFTWKDGEWVVLPE